MSREHNSSCSFKPIALKLHRWLGHGLKMCILFAHKSQIHFSRVRGPWFMPKISFRSISCERIDGLGSYFAYILLLSIPSLGLSHDIFRQFSAELLALINGQKWYPLNINILWASLGGSVGCAVRLETRRSRVQPPPRSATFFRGDWSWNIFYSFSPFR